MFFMCGVKYNIDGPKQENNLIKFNPFYISFGIWNNSNW